MDKLTRKEVEHVADLAKLALTEEEIEKYRVELKQLIDDIDKVKDIKNYDEDFLIAPFSRDAELRSDEKGEMLDYKVAMENVPHKSGNFVEVPVMLNE